MTASGHAAPAVVVGVTIATTVLAGLAVASRLLTRLTVVKKGGPDDVCISIAMTLSIALTITMCQQVVYGMGSHYSTLQDSDKMHLMQWFWASVWIYYSSLCFTKLSIILQYLRVFPSEKFRRGCYILMGVIIAYSLATFLTSVLACVPVASFWDPGIEGTCVDLKAVWFTNATINIVTDICTGVLPLPTLKNLPIPKRQKYALMAVFALGGFTCIVSILRLQSLYVVSVSKDLTWNNPLAAIWSSTETNVGIICSCLPTLKGCITHFFPRFFSSSNSAHVQSGRGTGNTAHSRPEWQENGFDQLELPGRNKNKVGSHVQSREEEDSLEELTSSSPPDTTYDGLAKMDSSPHSGHQTKELAESRGSDIVRQPTRAQSFYQVV